MIGTMWAIARAIGGISLNGDEYLMGGNGISETYRSGAWGIKPRETRSDPNETN